MALAHVTGPARKLGLSLAEYLARKAAGLKWCWRCRAWLPLADFPMNNSQPDKLNVKCRRCARTDRAAYVARKKARLTV